MSNQQIRHLLARLESEIKTTKLDSDTRELVRQLDADIHELLESQAPETGESDLLQRAKELEANFATEYPAAERFIRELIDALARMGI